MAAGGEHRQVQVGTALVLKKATQTAAANQAADNQAFMDFVNKVKRQKKAAQLKGAWLTCSDVLHLWLRCACIADPDSVKQQQQ